jgi:hypothetical protein
VGCGAARLLKAGGSQDWLPTIHVQTGHIGNSSIQAHG